MQFQIDHDFHIHSFLSSCSNDPEQNPEWILGYARRHCLKTIVLTDHFWDSDRIDGASDWYRPQDLTHIKSSLPLPQTDGIRFLFGLFFSVVSGFSLLWASLVAQMVKNLPSVQEVCFDPWVRKIP